MKFIYHENQWKIYSCRQGNDPKSGSLKFLEFCDRCLCQNCLRKIFPFFKNIIARHVFPEIILKGGIFLLLGDERENI